MLKNNNKGAGLVTVVTVLAVCGILLAGVLSFAYQHYKSEVLSNEEDTSLFEVEFCAQVLLHRTGYNKNNNNEASDILKNFYGNKNVSGKKNDEPILVSCDGGTVRLELNSRNIQKKPEFVEETWTISYIKGEETVISYVYYYEWETTWNHGEWQIVEVLETSAIETARAEIELCAEKLLLRTKKVYNNNYHDRNAKEKDAKAVLEKAYGDPAVNLDSNNRISVKRDGGTIYLDFVEEDRYGIEKWQISYEKDGDTVLSLEYSYEWIAEKWIAGKWKPGKWQFAGSPELQRNTEDNLS